MDKRRSNLIVWYHEKDKKGIPAERSAEFLIDQQEKRDEIVAALAGRLGPGWATAEREVGLAEAAVGNVICILLAALAVPALLWIIHFVQGDYLFADVPGGRLYRIERAVIHLVQAAMRWCGVFLDWFVIVLAVAACGIWVAQIRTPPLMWTMERPKP